MSLEPFEEIWRRIVACSGQQFLTKRKLVFTYEIRGSGFHPSRTKYRISKSDFLNAYQRFPIDGPHVINSIVRGPAYVWSVLHDERISGAELQKPVDSGQPKRGRGKEFERRAIDTMSSGHSHENKALILIPCCRSKKESGVSFQRGTQPLQGIQSLRDQLLSEIKLTQDIANKHENQEGILNPVAQMTKALDLYKGIFYQAAGNSLLEVAEGRYSTIDILIVSAFYGLVRLDEGLKKYELKMGDTMYNGSKVYKFWQKQELWQILVKYIEEHTLTHIWSLLPDSTPGTPYNRVFNQLWEELGNSRVECYWVKLKPQHGQGTPFKRGQWLKAVLESISHSQPKYLIGKLPPERFDEEIPQCAFSYQVLNR